MVKASEKILIVSRARSKILPSIFEKSVLSINYLIIIIIIIIVIILVIINTVVIIIYVTVTIANIIIIVFIMMIIIIIIITIIDVTFIISRIISKIILEYQFKVSPGTPWFLDFFTLTLTKLSTNHRCRKLWKSQKLWCKISIRWNQKTLTFSSNIFNQLFRSTFGMPRSRKLHLLKKTELIWDPWANLRELNQFVTIVDVQPMSIKSTLNSLKYHFQALWAWLGVTTHTWENWI